MTRAVSGLSRLESQIIELKKVNKTATFIPIEAADLTLVADAKKAAEEIAKTAKRIDLLILSPGYISATRDESPEGLDRLTVIRYYARMQMLVTLAPLLRAAPSPRVVFVGGGGKEGQIWPEDFLLKEHYSLMNAAGVAASMGTLFLEEFAQKRGNEKMVFAHFYPGMVGDTGMTVNNIGWLFQTLLNWLIVPIMKTFGYSAKEAGERVLFAATNGRFRRLQGNASAEGTLIQQGSNGKVGSGMYLVQADSSVVTENKILKQMKSEGMGQKVYDHTMEVFDRIAKKQT